MLSGGTRIFRLMGKMGKVFVDRPTLFDPTKY
jgi:hypothetical protein